jgi:hypothetical protein
MPNRVIFLFVLLTLCPGCKSDKGSTQANQQPAALTYANNGFSKTGKYDTTYKSQRKILGKRSEKEVLSSLYTDKAKDLMYDYNRRLREHPGIGGWVVFRFQIVSSGQVISCTITDSQIDDKLLMDQLSTKITKWNFRDIKEADTTIVVFPFCFCS